MASSSGPILRSACPLWDASERAGEDLLDQFWAVGTDLGFFTMSVTEDGEPEYAATAGLLEILGLGGLVTIDHGVYSVDLEEINRV